MTTERLTLDPPGVDDAWLCPCGNRPSTDGFYPCDENGAEVEPTLGGPWDETRYVCARCGRIIDQNTLLVVGQAVLVDGLVPLLP